MGRQETRDKVRLSLSSPRELFSEPQSKKILDPISTLENPPRNYQLVVWKNLTTHHLYLVIGAA